MGDIFHGTLREVVWRGGVADGEALEDEVT